MQGYTYGQSSQGCAHLAKDNARLSQACYNLEGCINPAARLFQPRNFHMGR